MNKIKLIIFDLDGVLIDKNIHYQAFMQALKDIANLDLSYEEHEKEYDGRPTIQKLHLLTEKKGLDLKLWDKIWVAKQKNTEKLIEELKPNPKIIDLLNKLRSDKYNLALASNAIQKTVWISLDKLGITNEQLFPRISNEDIKQSKPYPSCYWRCMEYWNVLPKETLIIEDSPVGIEGANNSGGYVYECITPDYLDYDKIIKYIQCL